MMRYFLGDSVFQNALSVSMNIMYDGCLCENHFDIISKSGFYTAKFPSLHVCTVLDITTGFVHSGAFIAIFSMKIFSIKKTELVLIQTNQI